MKVSNKKNLEEFLGNAPLKTKKTTAPTKETKKGTSFFLKPSDLETLQLLAEKNNLTSMSGFLNLLIPALKEKDLNKIKSLIS